MEIENKHNNRKLACNICKNFNKKEQRCNLNHDNSCKITFNKSTGNFEVSFCNDYITNEKYIYF